MVASKGKVRPYRHTFWFHFGTGKGLPHKVPVRLAKHAVELELTADDVRKAIKSGGVGNSMLCAGAQCLRRYERAFPHPVHPPADWLDSMVYIPDKISKEGLPISCVQYAHHDDIAVSFDKTPRKLLKRLMEDGPITIKLVPPRRTEPHPPPPGFVRRFTGERSGQIHDVVVVDHAEPRERAADSVRADLPRPAAIGETSDPGRGPKHRFARAQYGIGRIKRV